MNVNARAVFALVAIVLFLAVGMAGSAIAQPAVKAAKGAPFFTVKLMTKKGAGRYLADAKGMSLYYFKKDPPGKSVCAGECLAKWPAFYAEKVMVPKKVKGRDFGEITRPDGKKQTTYKGFPLYYFFKDAKPGDTLGEGVNNVWYLVYPAKFKR